MIRPKRYKIKFHEGVSLIEIVLAMAIFSVIMIGLVSLIASSYANEIMEGDLLLANNYASQGMEAIKSIREQGWNNLIFHQSGVNLTSGRWYFSGEGTVNILGKFTRTIIFADIWRNTSGAMVDAGTPGAILDLGSKKVTSQVAWDDGQAVQNLNLVEFLTNWHSQDWTQNNWSGGFGQLIWSAPDRYRNGNNIDVSTPGELKLALRPGGKEPRYYASGWLESSAFYANSSYASWHIISWTQGGSCNSGCRIRLQVATAPDNHGQPGRWSRWSGPTGSGSFYTMAAGTLIPITSNGKPWLKYRVELTGNTSNTPVLNQININYRL